MMNKQPELRFKSEDGQELPNWEEKKLEQVGRFKSGIGFSEKEQGGHSGIPFFKVSDMNLPQNKIRMLQANNYVSQEQITNNGYKPIKEESIIFAKVGAAVFLERKRIAKGFLIDNNMMAFTPFKQSSVNFLYNYLQKIRLSKFAQVGALPSYGAGDLKLIKIKLPSPIEQEKIADFLGAVDKRIDGLRRKKELLEDYKKGLMQQIFSQKIRFKDENDKPFPDWVSKPLGSISEVYQPQTISQAELTPSGYSVYGANGKIGFYTKFNHKTSQVIVTCRGNTCGTVNFTEPESWVTGNAMVINCDNNNNVNKTFLYYSLSYSDLRYLITGSGQPQITGEIKKHLILMPHYNEQQKIADFLNGIDTKINLATLQLEAAETFKKGLLQKMFV